MGVAIWLSCAQARTPQKNTPRWGFKKGWRAFKAAKRKRTRRSPSKRRRTTVKAAAQQSFQEKNNEKENFNVNLLDLGGGIVLADQFLGQQAFDQVLALRFPILKGCQLTFARRSTQEQLIKTGVGDRRSKDVSQGFCSPGRRYRPSKTKNLR